MASSSNPHRDLLRGSLELLILSQLIDGDQHGYALQKGIRRVSGQTIQAGTLYPLLHRLEDAGIIEATWDHRTKRPRKVYTITDTGRRRLKQQATDWHAMIARLQGTILPALRNVARA